MKLRSLLYESNDLEKNQRSIIHLSDGIEWHLQKRPNRFPLKNRVISLAAELRAYEHAHATEMLDFFNEQTENQLEWRICLSICHDVLSINRDRDFRFRPLLSGKEVRDHAVRIRIAEINPAEAQARVYNYRSRQTEDHTNVTYVLAHRGNMRFAKQSRLATDTWRVSWKEHFGNIIDMDPIAWGNISNLRDLLRMEDNRQCRHCGEFLSVRLQYTGLNSAELRASRQHSKKFVRTDAERQEENQRRAEKYNQ